MTVLAWIVAACLAIPLYSYLGYPVILFLLASLVQTTRDAYYLLHRKERRSSEASFPNVSIIIAAYNEEASIGATIAHCLALDYPPDQLEIIVGSDGSSDDTVEIAGQYEGNRVIVEDFATRRGKTSVIRDCVRRASGAILVFTDANTKLRFRSVRNLVRHFSDPRVGAVCGELHLVTSLGAPAGEGIYWRYEVMLKFLESRLDSVLGANGGIYAVRREVFPELPDNVITDDFVIPMKVRAAGLRVAYDPEATAVEQAPESVTHEFRRRMRIGAGNWQALRHCAPLLLPWKGFVSFAYWSHKVFRWVTPFLLVAALVANGYLVHVPFWRFALLCQLSGYALASAGLILRRLGVPAGPLRIPAYFVAINAALGVGFVKGMLGLQSSAWRRTARSAVSTRRPS